MKKEQKDEKCPVCERKTKEPCSRVQCGNRRPVTCDVPDMSSRIGVSSGCSYRAKLHNDD